MASLTRALPTGGGQKSTAMVKDSLDSAQRHVGAALGVEASFGRVPIRARVVLCNVVDPGRSFAGGAHVCTPGGARSFYTLRTSPQTIKASAACRTAEHSLDLATIGPTRTHTEGLRNLHKKTACQRLCGDGRLRQQHPCAGRCISIATVAPPSRRRSHSPAPSRLRCGGGG